MQADAVACVDAGTAQRAQDGNKRHSLRERSSASLPHLRADDSGTRVDCVAWGHARRAADRPSPRAIAEGHRRGRVCTAHLLQRRHVGVGGSEEFPVAARGGEHLGVELRGERGEERGELLSRLEAEEAAGVQCVAHAVAAPVEGHGARRHRCADDLVSRCARCRRGTMRWGRVKSLEPSSSFSEK